MLSGLPLNQRRIGNEVLASRVGSNHTDQPETKGFSQIARTDVVLPAVRLLMACIAERAYAATGSKALQCRQ